MKSNICKTFLFIAALFSSVASADPIFVFPLWDDNNKSVSTELNLSDNGLELSITAWTSSYNSAGDQLQMWQQVTQDGFGVFQDDDGLGVISVEGDGNDLDGGSTANYATDPDEGLLFVFNHKVDVYDLFIGDLSSNDDFNISIVEFISPTLLSLSNTIDDISGPFFASEWVFEFDGEFTGSAFMLWVDGGNDDIEVLGVAVVPEPNTILIFSLCLLAIVFNHKRKAANTSK